LKHNYSFMKLLFEHYEFLEKLHQNMINETTFTVQWKEIG
jgi:hypothetical protein